jgi:hypothetical protein
MSEVEGAVGGEEGFRPLPARKTLTDLLQRAELQVETWGLTPEVDDNYPHLATLWLRVRAMSRPARGEPGTASSDLWREWERTNGGWGDPERRDWRLKWIEAYHRLGLIVSYLTDSGALELGAAQADVPRNYLTSDELEVSR